jgi:hypothetical protein
VVTFEHAVLVGAASLAGDNDALCDLTSHLCRSAPADCTSLAPLAVRVALPIARALISRVCIPRARALGIARVLCTGALASRRLNAQYSSLIAWTEAAKLVDTVSTAATKVEEVVDLQSIDDCLSIIHAAGRWCLQFFPGAR